MTDTLADWLIRLERRHPRAIELGLTRCQAVWQRLAIAERLPPAISVAGTNGKGTTSSAIAAVATAHGLRCGLYQSPHLIRYNERVQLLGTPASDHALIMAFDAVEQARGDTSLTYFETGTLAALWLFAQQDLDLIVLEVGLGGRLDAVNIVDARVAVLTSIGLDHQDWLGPDRASIGYEKAGIARPHQPWVCAEQDLPDTVLAEVNRLQAVPVLLGSDYHCEPAARSGSACCSLTLSDKTRLENLDCKGHRHSNIATALQALCSWGLTLDRTSVEKGLANLFLPGRQQTLAQDTRIMVDVAHNAQAAQALADRLQATVCHGVRYALFGAMADKPLTDLIAPLLGVVDRWYVADLRTITSRAASGDTIAACLQEAGATVVTTDNVLNRLFRRAQQDLQPEDQLVVWGSFHIVGPILALHEGT